MSPKSKVQSPKFENPHEVCVNPRHYFVRASAFLLLTFLIFASSAAAQKERAISEVQGEKAVSEYEGKTVKLTGIVTARTRSGFYMQTPDGKTDNNPATSEGILIFTKTEPGAEATVGNLVSVTGDVTEFIPKQELASLPVTELSMQKNRDEIKVISKNNPLPKPIILTLGDFKSNLIDQLEKYEGMRVQVNEMMVVAPTKGRLDAKNGTAVSDGVFYGVLKGIARPFREPGMDIYDYLFAKDKDGLKKNYPKMPIFDGNPETLRIDSDEQLGAQTIDVTSLAEIKNLVGIMHYGYQKYTILPDPDNKIVITGLKKSMPLQLPNERQFSIAGMNLENFFDDEDDPSIKEDIVTTETFQNRLNKISAAIRLFLRMPDIIGTIEVENLTALKKLADKINADAVAAKQENPKYEAYLIDGNDGRGIDVGFLVKTSRVKVVDVKQFGKDEKFKNPNNKNEETLNDRPPLMLQAAIEDPKTNKTIALTVIVNHLKSFLGIDDPKDNGARVRLKREMQAEFLAKFVQERQKANPNENIILVGDFNAFQFNDGIGDIIGVIKGTPAPREQVLLASDDLVNPDLIDLVDLIKEEQRYSYSCDGNAQFLDHIIINRAMKKHLAGFGYARWNADFPQIYHADNTRVERFSDHDPAIAYFNFDEK
ncbi:hypothetical protein BH20ACI1_BH20ACI1_17800 [soil metagenome]